MRDLQQRESENQTIEFGSCIYNTFVKNLYATLPSSLSELNETMCGKLFNRTGILCGKCKDGHYPQAYSFDMNCIQCPNGSANWWKYLLAAYLVLCIHLLFLRNLFHIHAWNSCTILH